jgi:hypothetical protein
VEPIYLQAEASQLPELRRVIVVYGNRVVMEETLAEGLVRVVSGEAPAEVSPGEGPATPVLDEDMAELIRQADEYYQAGQACLQNGNWTCYGQNMDALEDVLAALVAASQESGE